MTFPNFAGKHAHDAIFEPHDFVAYQRRLRGDHVPPTPQGIILCYGSALWRHVRGGLDSIRLPGIPDDLLVVNVAPGVGVVGGFGIGAPAAAVVAELLLAWGARRIVSIGWAGGLQPGCAIGDLVLCTDAIRDEGLSHHYLEPARVVEPSPSLTGRLREALTAAGASFQVGHTWTTDALYRETVEETRHYQSEGVLTVEMEAAALAAVAHHRGAEFATAFVISDSLADLAWNPQFHAEATQSGLETLYTAAIAALR